MKTLLMAFLILLSSGSFAAYEIQEKCNHGKILKLTHGTAVHFSDAMLVCQKTDYETAKKLVKATIGTAVFFVEIVSAYGKFGLENTLKLRDYSHGVAGLRFRDLVYAAERYGFSTVECAHKLYRRIWIRFADAIDRCRN